MTAHPPRSTAAARRARVRHLVVASLIALVVATDIVPAAAQEPPEPGPAPTLHALEEARGSLPEHLRAVPATSAALRRAEQAVLDIEATIVTNRATRDEANLHLVTLGERRATQRRRISSERDRRLAAGIRAEELRQDLADLAVAAYVNGGRTGDVFPLDAREANDAGRQAALVDAVDATLRARLGDAEAEIATATRNVEQARAELEQILAEIDTTTARRDAAVAELAWAEPALPVAQEEYRDAFMVADVSGADFTVVAYDAYRSAASGASCSLPWSVLAGIGRVESRHGTYGGAQPRADGTTNPRIIGIALDGRPGVATITDTDGGALDGDAVHDRAVGPMQFIPSTWRSARRDGNGDGRMDPHNLYDAAAAAAGYLCASGGNLANAGNLDQAILSYNRSRAYVDAVLGHHRSYGRLGLP